MRVINTVPEAEYPPLEPLRPGARVASFQSPAAGGAVPNQPRSGAKQGEPHGRRLDVFPLRTPL